MQIVLKQATVVVEMSRN